MTGRDSNKKSQFLLCINIEVLLLGLQTGRGNGSRWRGFFPLCRAAEPKITISKGKNKHKGQ